MYWIYFDSGTSNTRAYLLKKDNLIDALKKNIGSKDCSINGSNTVLLLNLKELYDRLIENNGLEEGQIQGIYASGMVTSPFGIKEVPHLSTPLSLEALYSTMYKYYESSVFKRDIYLIRGTKTIPEGYKPDKYSIAEANNTRGEEIETVGILSGLSSRWKEGGMAIFLPGSHTHIIHIKDGIYDDILSTFSGELFYAISSSTILSSSVTGSGDRLDEEMVLLGYKNLKNYALNRALYIAHAMKVFDVCGNSERRSYLDGIITGGVVMGFEKMLEGPWKDVEKVIISGSSKLTKVYEIILKSIGNGLDIIALDAPGKESFAVKGFLEIMRQGGEL